jgi:hypothetical protein
MPRSHRPWIVTPHRQIEKLDENLWALASSLPRVTLTRRMSMVRLADRRIVFLDAVPMDEATLAEVRAWGTPALLVVTNGFHRLDVHAFRERLAEIPGLGRLVFCHGETIESDAALALRRAAATA